MDYYLLGLAKGLSWDDWQNMPGIVRMLCWTYAQMEAELASDRAKAT